MITSAGNAVGHRFGHAWRRLLGAVAQPTLILMYHRIAQDPLDPWKLCVSPANFAVQMEMIRRRHRPMRLADMTRQLQQGTCPRGAIVVTFDDGYRDNLTTALPLLEAFDVPATVFCTAGHVGREKPFWWDRLATLVLGPERLPPTLALDVADRHWRKDLGSAAHYLAAERALDRGSDGAPASPRMDLYRELWGWLRPLAESDRDAALRAIDEWSAGVRGDVAETPTPLSSQQLLTLAASPLIEIGAHSVTHAALPALPPAAQRHEIGQSKAQLEQLIGRPVLNFAYPFGDQSTETAALVREAGFQSSCTTASGAVRVGTDPFHLPRIGVGNWDGDTFTNALRGLL